MPRPKPAEEPIQIVLRVSPTQLARIDAEAVRSKRSRNGVIADAISFHLADSEGIAARKAATEHVPTEAECEAYFRGDPMPGPLLVPDIQVGLRKPEYGSMLKKPKGSKL